MAIKKAKVGDYVKVIKKLPYKDQMDVKVGDIGVVNYVASTGKYSVHIKGKNNPHDKNVTVRTYGKLYDFWIPFECCEVIDNEALTRQCLFENADALDIHIASVDNTVCLSTISNDVSTWSGTIYKGNDCVMPTYTYLKESEEKKMKEIKNQKVVDLYFKRKREEIDKRHKELRTEIIKADRNQVFIEELQKKYDEYCESNKEDLGFLSGRFDATLPLTKESMSKDAENDTLYENEISHLKELKEEITAMLSGCETYEQEMEILHTYNIIDYNTHYVKMNQIYVTETN